MLSKAASLGRAAILPASMMLLQAAVLPAVAQPVARSDTPALPFVTLDYGTNATFLTGIRGNVITGQDVIAGGGNGGLIWSTTTQSWTAFPAATVSGVNYPGAIDNTPYGPSFGSYGGILRAVGSYQTTASSPYGLGYLYDAAGGASGTLTTLQYPSAAADPTLFTIAHSTFGNQVVGNYDTRLATGNAFLYDIPSGIYTNVNKPGAVSTTAYGVWGNLIAGGYTGAADARGVAHGYIYNETTGIWTTYDHPGAIETHFEGIAGGGRSGTYNLVTDWTGPDGQPHAAILHIDAQGNQSWVDLAVPGAVLTSANSMYGSTALGIYVDQTGGVHGYTVDVPGIYDPIRNTGLLVADRMNAVAIAGAPGDDVVNTGTILAIAAGGIGVSSDTYGVVTNSGAVSATGTAAAAVRMNGAFGTLLNYGTLSAAPGAFAIATGPTASGSLVVNAGTIDGQVAIAAGPYARFENSGWLGISAAGSGVVHAVSGTFVQTAAGTLQLRVAADGSHDALRIAGTGRLAGGLTLATQPGLYADQTEYRGLVSTTGALGGAFGTVQTTSPFLRASVTTGENSVSAVLMRQRFDALPGLTANQRAVGGGLEAGYGKAAAGTQAATFYAGLLGTAAPAATVAGTYDTLGGEGLTGSQQMLLAVSAGFAEAIRQQVALWLEDAPASSGMWRGWGAALGGGGHLDADTSLGAARLDADAWGGAAGIDNAVSPDLLVGVALGGAGAGFSVPGRQTSGTAAGGEGGVYAAARADRFYVQGILAYGRYGVATNRTAGALGSGLQAQAKAGFDAGVFTGRLEGGYTLAAPAAEVTPFIAHQPSWIMLPGYTESVAAGGAPTGLTVRGKIAAVQPVSLGVQVSHSVAAGDGWALLPMVRAAWVHDFATGRSLDLGFTAIPGATFQLQGPPVARNAALLTGTLAAAHSSALTLLAGVQLGLSGASQALGGQIGVRVSW
jgi:uncharacterized protein with beta-barrel porin domain